MGTTACRNFGALGPWRMWTNIVIFAQPEFSLDHIILDHVIVDFPRPPFCYLFSSFLPTGHSNAAFAFPYSVFSVL